MYKKILVPTDDSEHSKKAARHAKWIAESCQAEILILNVFETSNLNPIRSRSLKEEMKELWKEEAEKKLEKMVKIFQEDKGADLKVNTLIKEGNPINSILETINEEKIDLTVMESSGKNTLDRLFIGSVAENVVRSANSPVMIIH